MMPKLLSSIEELATLEELQVIVDILDDGRGHKAPLSDELALPVREARADFSKLLNDVASHGGVAFIESGDGPAVLVIGARRLAEAVVVLKDKKKPTVRDAVGKLPFKRDQVSTFALKGHKVRRRSLFDHVRPEPTASSTNSM